MKTSRSKAFNTLSAAMLGVGSMVGAGIFIVIGQAGAIAGNLVWLSFILGGAAALLSGYSLSRLALRYPSRGGLVEYLVQSYGEGLFSGTLSVLFYFSQLIAIAAVAKSFGAYSAALVHGLDVNAAALGIVLFFVVINLLGASLVARSENLIVIVKVTVLSVFALAALLNADPSNLNPSSMPKPLDMLFAVGLTFFAYQGFSVITNTVEEMPDPAKTMPRAMTYAIVGVMALYVVTALAVLGNLSLSTIIATKDYALAEAAKPVFGEWGFKVMAATALLATASAINATLYATAEIGYTMAKEGTLPKIYRYNLFRSYEGLIVSALLIIPMVLFLNLSQITAVAALAVLLVQGAVHVGHLRRLKQTGASAYLVAAAALAMFSVAALSLAYNYRHQPEIPYYLAGAFLLAFCTEGALRVFKKRVVTKQVVDLFDA